MTGYNETINRGVDTEATYYKCSNLRDLLPATSHNNKQSSGFASR